MGIGEIGALAGFVVPVVGEVAEERAASGIEAEGDSFGAVLHLLGVGAFEAPFFGATLGHRRIGRDKHEDVMLAVPFVCLRRVSGAIEVAEVVLIDFHPADGVARLGQRAAAAWLEALFHRLQIGAGGGDLIREDVEFKNARSLQQALQVVGAGDGVLDGAVLFVFGLEGVHCFQAAREIGELLAEAVEFGVAGLLLVGIVGSHLIQDLLEIGRRQIRQRDLRFQVCILGGERLKLYGEVGQRKLCRVFSNGLDLIECVAQLFEQVLAGLAV